MDTDESVNPDESGEYSTDNTFDPAVTTAHSYLGNDLEVVHGRTLLDNGICMNLPILFEVAVILFPDQTLPMVQYSTDTVNMLRSCLKKDKTFGVVHGGMNLVHGGMKKKIDIGTTAEIYEYSDNEPDGFRIKARGRQRFKILKTRRVQGQILADVKILPEINLGPPFFDERLASLDRIRTIPKNSKEAREQEYKVTRRDSIITPWPSWVYRQYDARRLAMRIHKRCTNIPEDPAELSFWLTQNLFMNDSAKIALLKFDCAISRLQYEAQILSRLGRKVFVCSTCKQLIGKHSDIVSMNKEGLQAAYCNPGGAIHETLTLYKAENVILDQEPPTTVCSWFPGYAWTIAYCSTCRFHVGWNFIAVKENLKPRTFWGLTRNNLILKRENVKRRQIDARHEQTVNLSNESDENVTDDDDEDEEDPDPDPDPDDDDGDDDDEDDVSQRSWNFRLQMP